MLVAESWTHPGYEVTVSSLSWAELGYGLRKAVDPVERARQEARASRLRVVLGPGIHFDRSDEAFAVWLQLRWAAQRLS